MTWADIIIPKKTKIIRFGDKIITFYMTQANTVNMYFSSSFIRDIADHCITLGYSANRNAVILFLSKESDEMTLNLSKRAKTNSATASVQFLVNSCNIDTKDLLGRYMPEMEIIDEKICYVIYLNKNTTPAILEESLILQE